MPKNTYIDAIFERLRHPESPASPNYFLFLLGTDTVFTPTPSEKETDNVKKRYYKRGETLSYAAQVVVSLMGEAGKISEAGDPLSYTSPSVDVLNGPTTRGVEVGQRIAQGILLALSAIAAGKSNLQITAHSRGAVEAILIMHELERIQIALRAEPTKSLCQILLDSPCAYTQTAMASLITTGDESEQLRATLANKLESVKINPFLIDPVPGGRLFKLPKVAWRDPRFYQPVRYNKAELMIARDERTGAFIPVITEGMQPIIIPGHHGSASGNQYTQQYDDLPNTLQHRNTTTVQDLVLCRLFNFFHQTTGAFDSLDGALDLGHPALDRVTNAFLSSDTLTRQQRMLSQYNEILENDEAYRAFNNTYYNFILGTESIDGHRMVHLHGHNYKRLSECAPIMPESSFVNNEHAMLYFSDIVGADITNKAKADALLTLITWAVGNITTEVEVDDPEDKFERLISSPEGRKVFFKGLAVLIDTISQQYLRNHLSVEDKSRLMKNISAPFTTLNEAKKNLQLQEKKAIFEECEKILQQGLKQTVETHYFSIVEQAKRVHHQVQLFLAPTGRFADVFKTYLDGLVTDDINIHQPLVEIREMLLELDPSRVDVVQQVLSDISEKIGSSMLEPEEQEKLNRLIFGNHAIQLNEYFEAYECSIERYLLDLEQIYNAVCELKNASPLLSDLVADQQLDIDLDQLFIIENSVPALALQILQAKGYDFSHPLESISPTFYDVVKNQAIALGALSPLQRDLENRLQSQSVSISELEDAKEELEQDIQLLAHTIVALEHQNDEKTLSIDSLKHKIAQFRSVKERRNDALIQNKIIPLTENYLHHLLTEASDYCPGLDCNLYQQELPDTDALSIDDASKKAYASIKHKLNAVQDLYRLLTCAELDILPSDRIVRFANHLADSENDLKLHRDPAWITFTKSCFSVIAFLVTGIVPGLIYLTLTGRSPLFFTKSRGHQFVEDCYSTLNASDHQI